MKRQMKSPRIFRILKIDGYVIDFAFRNGEIKRVDFNEMLDKSDRIDPLNQLKQYDVFSNCQVNENGVVYWPKAFITIEIPGLNPSTSNLEMDPETLYSIGTKSPLDEPFNYGLGIKLLRQSKQLTLSQLSKLCGISESELSRVENNKNIELDTLRRIYFFGFNMHIAISGVSRSNHLSLHNYRKSAARLSKLIIKRNTVRIK